jgi:hypothetical protein
MTKNCGSCKWMRQIETLISDGPHDLKRMCSVLSHSGMIQEQHNGLVLAETKTVFYVTPEFGCALWKQG